MPQVCVCVCCAMIQGYGSQYVLALAYGMQGLGLW